MLDPGRGNPRQQVSQEGLPGMGSIRLGANGRNRVHLHRPGRLRQLVPRHCPPSAELRTIGTATTGPARRPSAASAPGPVVRIGEIDEDALVVRRQIARRLPRVASPLWCSRTKALASLTRPAWPADRQVDVFSMYMKSRSSKPRSAQTPPSTPADTTTDSGPPVARSVPAAPGGWPPTTILLQNGPTTACLPHGARWAADARRYADPSGSSINGPRVAPRPARRRVRARRCAGPPLHVRFATVIRSSTSPLLSRFTDSGYRACR